MTEQKDLELSVVVPLYYEEEILHSTYRTLLEVLEKDFSSFEIIFVDDGSADRTYEIACELERQDPRVKVIGLTRNFGKDIALSAGLDEAVGKFVVPLDADLQDPPQLIRPMIDRLLEGYDVVYGVRTIRHGETRMKRLTAWLFYKVASRLASVKIPENTGDFRVMRQEVVVALRLVREQARFMKGIFAWVGFRQVPFFYERNAREQGGTKWNYFKLWNFALDGITSFSIVPLRLASYLGLLIASLSFLLGAYYGLKALIFGDTAQGFPTLVVLITLIGGIQLICLGIIGEYIGRVFLEAKSRPLYLKKQRPDT